VGALSNTPLSERPGERLTGQIPSLDGLRAVSILLVVLCHVASTGNSPLASHASWYHKAAIGVDVFFVISGFLITTLLLRELATKGRVSLTGFWKRRALRILPAFFVYLGVLALLDSAGYVNVLPRDWAAATTYTVNFFAPVTHVVGHIWSLSVEEHFYVVWPILFILAGATRAAKLAFLALLVEPVIRGLTFRQGTFDIDFVTFARYDAIAAGCLLAMFAQTPSKRALLARLEARPMTYFFAALATLAVSVFVLSQSGKYKIFCYPLVNALAICVMVWTAIRCPWTRVGRFLNAAPLAWVGRLSYSLYLWQQLFLDPTNSARWVCRFPQNVILSFSAAVASYYLVERPMMRFRKRHRAEAEPTAIIEAEPPMRLAA
jgi:peptidoglycan/LPS O-acetylase OafA/YrhL